MKEEISLLGAYHCLPARLPFPGNRTLFSAETQSTRDPTPIAVGDREHMSQAGAFSVPLCPWPEWLLPPEHLT